MRVLTTSSIAYSGLLCLAFAAGGCRTTKDVLDDYERNVSSGNYSAAVPEVTELAEKQDGSQQMWRLLSASANYMSGDREKALRQFDAAEDVFRKNDLTSVFAQAGHGALAMMTNDKAFPYDGGGQDRIFTCIYRFIDFACEGNREYARVELNRACQYQSNWTYDRKKEIAAAADRLEKDATAYQKSQGQADATTSASRGKQTSQVLANPSFAAQVRSNCGFDVSTSGRIDATSKRDYTNAYMYHLAGVFRWLNNDSDMNMLRDAARFVPENPVVARDYAELDSGVVPSDQVWIWVEDGLCQCREEWRIDLPLIVLPYVNDYVMYAGMAFPKLRSRAAGAAAWTVSSADGITAFSALEDVDRLVQTEFDVYMRGALAREITRTIVKVGVQAALGAAAEAARRRAEKKGGGMGEFWALKIAQGSVAAWAAATTGADLRSWTALPKSVKVARVTRPPDGRIIVYAGPQRIEINVNKGNSMVFIRKPAPGAMPCVKVATWMGWDSND